jgi:AraC-like DNA-binding protein
MPGFEVVITERERGSSVSKHVHALPMVATILGGELSFRRDDGAVVRPLPGAWYFSPAYVPEEHIVCPTSIRALGIVFNPESLNLTDLPAFSTYIDSPYTAGITRHIEVELFHSDKESLLVLYGLCVQIIGEILRNGKPLDQIPLPKWLEDARAIVHERFFRPITLQQVADLVGVHRGHLSKVFQCKFELSFSEYLLNLRLMSAHERVVQTNDKFAVIAAETGFADHSHFSRQFQRKYGCTPTEVRRQATQPPSS